MSLVSLTDYYLDLSRHDWTHEMSDDHSVARAGRAEHSRLAAIARQSTEHEKMWQSFIGYHFGAAEKPVCPEVSHG